MTFLLSGRVLALAFYFLAAPVWAAPITYTISGVGDGCIGGEAFREARFVFLGVSDTDNLDKVDDDVSIFALMQARVDVEGVGSGVAVDPFYFFVNNALSVVGIIDGLVGDVLDVSGPNFFEFDGAVALPSSGVSLYYFSPFLTTAGFFILDDVHSLSFATATRSVSSPSSLWLLVGVLVVVLFARFSRFVEWLRKSQSDSVSIGSV